jgi:hypothetical protein
LVHITAVNQTKIRENKGSHQMNLKLSREVVLALLILGPSDFNKMDGTSNGEYLIAPIVNV